jgi:hypothetical protein
MANTTKAEDPNAIEKGLRKIEKQDTTLVNVRDTSSISSLPLYLLSRQLILCALIVLNFHLERRQGD